MTNGAEPEYGGHSLRHNAEILYHSHVFALLRAGTLNLQASIVFGVNSSLFH